MNNDFEEISIDDNIVEESQRKKKTGKTKICKYCKEEINAKAKVCRYCNRKQNKNGCATFILALIILFIFIPFIFGKSENENKKQQILDKSYNIGETVVFNDISIKYISSDKYISNNQFISPKEGNEFYRVEFEFENIGNSDFTISSMANWNCYADGYLVNQTWINMDDDLSGTLSAGKKMKGSLYFEIPVGSNSVILEYKNNIWIDDIIKFIVK